MKHGQSFSGRLSSEELEILLGNHEGGAELDRSELAEPDMDTEETLELEGQPGPAIYAISSSEPIFLPESGLAERLSDLLNTGEASLDGIFMGISLSDDLAAHKTAALLDTDALLQSMGAGDSLLDFQSSVQAGAEQVARFGDLSSALSDQQDDVSSLYLNGGIL